MAARPAPWLELRTLLLLGLAFGFAYLDRMAITFLSPYVVKDLHLDNTQMGALGSALSITWALGAYFIGRWSDRRGARKPFLLAALLVFSGCSLLSGLARSYAALFAARAVMGAVEGPFLPICLAIITAVTVQERRGLNAGIAQNVFGSILGTAVAPVVLVYVADRLGWHAAFYASGIPGLILAVLIWRFIPEPPRVAPAADASHDSAFSMLANRNIALCAGISCMMVGSMVTGSIYLPLYFTEVRGLTPATMAWIMFVLGFCPAVGGVLVPWLSDRIGRRPPMIVFCALLALCPLAALYIRGPLPLMTALMFVGWLGAGTFPLFMGIVPAEALAFRSAAAAMGLVVAVGELTGGVFSPLLGGWAADRFTLAAPLLLQAVLPLLAMVLALGLRETNPRRTQMSPARVQA
ncbi:MAG TPA: MFS transporter [Steroidobacteraceae bacterium]|nr:MFS transporter [Steroidobacteraceae bacterium]